ncbi:hypothetical protein ACHWQZ_G015217 [Mnemiopsis leidyi]
MFAPDDVFKTDPLPHGYYWPSPMSNQQGIVLQPQKFTCPQEKIAPQKNAAASSQQLKDSLTNLSNHSDTGMQVLSPSALRYYMERFKHSDPTHPLERSSELSRIVPKEVICPADENEDILYQWRLKRHINEAKNSLPLDDDYVKAKKTSSPHNKNSLSDSEYSVKSPKSYCVSKEIQTDVEKRETGCQAMIIEDYSSRDSVPSKVGFKPKVLNTVHNLISDSCSDISISSDSSDDLTTISDLDEDHYESVFENKFESADLIKPGCFATNTPSQLACSDKLFKEVSPSCNENVSNPFGTQNAAPKTKQEMQG